MKLALLQPYVSSDASANLERNLGLLDQAVQMGADMAILPELWNTPFDNESIKNSYGQWDDFIGQLQKKAKETGLWILSGTLARKTDTGYRNSAALINDKGEIVTIADKMHLLEVHTKKNDYKESDVFEPGNTFCKADTPWGKIGILICYDLRFPELSRLLGEDCFMLAAPAAFNAQVGAKHWRPLLQTRAMENELFVAGVNPAAAKYPSYSSYGHSMVCSPDGEVIWEMDGNAGVAIVDIDEKEVEWIRKRSPFWYLRRKDLYKLEVINEENSYH